MIIDCSYCKAKVDAKILASHEEYDPEIDPFKYKVSLLVCPSCDNSLVGIQEYIQISDDRFKWDKPTRVWPAPKKYISHSVPSVVRSSLEEAAKCVNAEAYTAAVAMCGRALEGVCRHFKTKNPYLGGGIKELLEQGIIDKRIYQWSEELHKHRNIAAHAEDQQLSKEDATDLNDFAVAISEYVFILAEKFNNFIERQKSTKKKSSSQHL